MSDKTEPPDWLDELYQEGNNEGPPASVDASILAAARRQSSARPWYLRARSLASAATIVLGLGITALWMGEPDLAELAAPSTQEASAELKVADQQKKQRPQTIAPTEPQEEDSIGTAAARSPVASNAEFARSALAQEAVPDSERAMAADLAEPHEMPGILEPGDCATLTLIDVGTTMPYALCRLEDNQLRVHHPRCQQAFELSDQTVAGDRDTHSLTIINYNIDHDQRSQLTCNPETGTWMLQLLPAMQLQQ